MKIIDKLHNLSLHGLTLSGIAALTCLAANVVTALIMFTAEHHEQAE